MGIFRKKENRSFDPMGNSDNPTEDVLLRALLGNSVVTKQTALNIPTLNSCIEYVAGIISMLPIKLYKEENGEVTEIKDDPRIGLINDDPGDTLDAVQFKKALIRDYYIGKGGYAYKNNIGNKTISLHYVDEEKVSINPNNDPIFKDYDILVNGQTYKPFEFIKLLRKTKDGATGTSILEEAPLILNVGYNTLKFENAIVQKGGNKKGFLKSENKLDEPAKRELKEAWRNLYSNNEENVVILNKGLDFKESSNSSVEMQLNENKLTNAAEICKLFNLSEPIIRGTATEKDYINSFNVAIMPVIKVIECALNRDFLLEKEKSSFYWAVDTKELTKGDIKTRYEAYKLGVEAKFLQPDEIRYMEDLKPLGLDFIQLGLDTVLYNPKSKKIYTPNTDKTSNMEGGE